MIYTPAQVAAQLSISPQTLRRWSALWASALSASAAPGPGQRRAYTDGDLAILRHAQRMIAGGQSVADIAAALPTIAPMDDTPPASAVATIPDNTQERFVSALTIIADQKADIARLQSDLAALTDRLQSLEQAAQRPQPPTGILARIFRRR